MASEYLSQTEIGQLYGVSPRVVGKWLKALGLRTAEGDPTTTACDLGYVAPRASRQPGVNFYVWHREKVVALLERRNE